MKQLKPAPKVHRTYRQEDVEKLIQSLEANVMGPMRDRLHSKDYDRKPASSAIADCMIDASRAFREFKEAL